jgi:dipeptidyl aminopeptidase/acylaminoacyl peptidase
VKRLTSICAVLLGSLAMLAPLQAHAQNRYTYTTQELTLPSGGGRAWIYLPDQAAGDRIPVVLVGPAGSHLVDGMTLGEGDRREHIPYARAGFAVVSFDIPGMATTDDEFVQAAREFKNGEGGVLNARDALQLALDRFPRLDSNNVFVAGHSSAATLALTLCARLERLRGCVAYAPDVDLIKSRGEIADILEAYIPGERAFLATISPIELVDQIRSPVMIFNARDDDVVPIAEIDNYAQRAERAHVTVSRVVVARGGHYQSMIDEGIPAGIAWMRAHFAADPTQ